jgi:hypothetical protein
LFFFAWEPFGFSERLPGALPITTNSNLEYRVKLKTIFNFSSSMTALSELTAAAASFQLQFSLATLQQLNVFQLVHDFRAACDRHPPGAFCQLRCSILTGSVTHTFSERESAAPANTEILLSCRRTPPDPANCTWILHPDGNFIADQVTRKILPVDSLSSVQIKALRKKGWERIHLSAMPPNGWIPLGDADPDVTSVADALAKLSARLRSHINSLEQGSFILS